MNLVVDANILFAALVKEGKTVEILLNPYFNLFATEFLFEEFEKYKEVLLHKTHRKEEGFYEILDLLKEIVDVIPRHEYEDKIGPAKEISPDENDVDYFALAIKLKCAIWSNDKKLKNQEKIKVYSTQELVELLK
jgi:predicted nucleic acid-binding protein